MLPETFDAMIVIINGPLGVGKSETSWALLSRFERAALLDADYLAALHPFDYYNQADLDYVYNVVGLLTAHHVAHGITTLVINWVFESPEQINRITAALSPCGLPIYVVRLTCDPDEIERRIRRRNQVDLSFEIQRSRQLITILDAAAYTGDMGDLIDTTHLTITEIVDTIWAHVHMLQTVKHT